MPRPAEHTMERRHVHAVTAASQVDIGNVIDPKVFTSWRKLIRVIAWLWRLVENIRSRGNKRGGGEAPLTPEELAKAEMLWIRSPQRSPQRRLENGEFKALSPFVDGKGIIRVGGRIDKVIVSYEKKHPVLLPSDHRVSLLIISHIHNWRHQGVATTTAKSRRKYWVLKANRLSKAVKFKCVTCRKMAHENETQFMTELPPVCLAPQTPPFHYTACDYFGPLSVKVGRYKKAKRYGVIFTCLNTRALHLEMAVDCTTMELVQVLRRFFAVRG